VLVVNESDQPIEVFSVSARGEIIGPMGTVGPGMVLNDREECVPGARGAALRRDGGGPLGRAVCG
jgi:hypothetical protein